VYLVLCKTWLFNVLRRVAMTSRGAVTTDFALICAWVKADFEGLYAISMRFLSHFCLKIRMDIA
jgi:hypothetical protein